MTTTLSHIPLPLRINIIYKDDEIIVVSKPPHLRTVPGNAEEATTTTRVAQPKLTASQAWKQALQHYSTIKKAPHDDIDTFLCQVAKVEHFAKCLPHKWKSFQSFVKRNWNKYGATTFSSDTIIVEEILPRIFQRLSVAQRRLLPQATSIEESVLGQLALLLGYDTNSMHLFSNYLHIVHRLDCATSGVLVIARTSTAAAALCRAWRERESVSKVYLARVHNPPSKNSNDDEWRTISDPMKPSTERLKWEITTPDDPDAKPCTTLWRKSRPNNNDWLELKPITGRTHQLRVHCQAHFGGIVGDTLYGTTGSNNEDRLYLHAYQLSFPHPRTGEQVTFVKDPEW